MMVIFVNFTLQNQNGSGCMEISLSQIKIRGLNYYQKKTDRLESVFNPIGSTQR